MWINMLRRPTWALPSSAEICTSDSISSADSAADGRPFAQSPARMQCPECHAAHEPDATVCSSCGLLLIASQAPKRRAEDFASQRRRAEDQTQSCQFCHGEIQSNSIRCKHCGEI